jgi:hypothetical protein
MMDVPPPHHETQRKLELTRRVVNTMSPAAPEYLHWSESLITFDGMDHPNSILKLGKFPLIVDPTVEMTRLTKSIMDGGSSLNLMYLNSFEGLGLTWDQLQSSQHLFYEVVPGKQPSPAGGVSLPVTFGDVSNFCTETLAFKVVDFTGLVKQGMRHFNQEKH